MQIDLEIYLGEQLQKNTKNEVIFEQDETAHFYYQILDVSVRMFNSNLEGKGYTKGLFYKGEQT